MQKWLIVVTICNNVPQFDAIRWHLSDLVVLYRSCNVALCMPAYGDTKDDALESCRILLHAIMEVSVEFDRRQLDYRKLAIDKSSYFDGLMKKAVSELLDASGSKKEVAEKLGVNRKTVYRLMKRYGLDKHVRTYKKNGKDIQALSC